MFRDLRYGLRMLGRSPLFSLVAVFVLAMGIGVNTAIFSVINAVLLRPLPYPDPEHLTMVFGTSEVEGQRGWTSPLNYVDLSSQQQSFMGLAAMNEDRTLLGGADAPEEVSGWAVTASFLPVMGVQPAIGHSFTDQEDQPGGDKVIILSHGLWQRRFGSDRGVVGKALLLNNTPFTIIGVMPERFDYPLGSDYWRPMQMNSSEQSRGSHNLTLIARRKPGVSVEEAQADMTRIARNLEQEFPADNQGRGLAVAPLQEVLTGEVRPALLILIGAVGLVLLIACSNVANLLLVRSATREVEVAVRTAMGADRGRVVRQFLTENLILAFLAGVLGLLLGSGGARLLASFSPREIPRLDEVSVDLRVLGFTFLLSFLTVLLFGIVPALQASKIDLNSSLKEAGRGTSGSRRRSRSREMLIAVELTLTVLLMIGGGLLMKSFILLMRVHPGFEAKSLVTMDITLPPWKYNPANAGDVFASILERIRAVPGVRAAGAAMSRPVVSTNQWGTVVILEGQPTPPAVASLNISMNPVTPDYFRAMEIPLIKGRFFSERDEAKAPGVVIVSEKMANTYFPGQDPLGKTIQHDLDFGPEIARSRVIVGVVGDVRQTGLALHEEPAIYVPHRQIPYPKMSILVRTSSASAAILSNLQDAVWAIDKEIPVENAISMEDLLASSVGQPRFYMALMSAFAALALILAAVGVYGLLAYSVTQRMHEIGVRMALGANQKDVRSLILRQALGPAAIGLILGLASAFALSRALSSLLYGIEPTDPSTYVIVSLILLAIVLLVSYIPAQRATKLELTDFLRYE